MSGGARNFAPWNKPPLLIPHHSSATGDTIHVAGALALYDDLTVVVVHPDKPGTYEDLLDFYRGVVGVGASKERVKVVYTKDVGTSFQISGALTDKDGINALGPELFGKVYDLVPSGSKKAATVDDFRTLYLKPPKVGTEYGFVGTLGRATGAIGDKFGSDKVASPTRTAALKDLYTLLAKRLSDDQKDDIFGDQKGTPTFKGKALPKTSARVALLWARYSGTNSLTGYNPEGDSSIKGQEQLLDLLDSQGIEVITIGHGPRDAKPVKSAFDVGEFYLQEPGKEPKSRNRAWQTRFFLSLMQLYPGKLIQIGQKTGGMDCAALLGVPTLYLEHQKSGSGARMQKWVDRVPFYRTYETELPPSRIGVALRVVVGVDPATGAKPDLRPSPHTRFACMILRYPVEMAATGKENADSLAWAKATPRRDFTVVRADTLAEDGPNATRIRLANNDDKHISGYSRKDISGIGDALTELWKAYEGETTIIRTGKGEYKTRKEESSPPKL